MKHFSVLKDEAINSLNIKNDGIYVDATLGYGGHSLEIHKRLKRGFLFAFDEDYDAINYSKKKLNYDNVEIIHSNFVNLKKELEKRGISKVDGIIFDLGISSAQIDEKERGFSFQRDGVLDMRMNKDNKLSAKEVVNDYPLHNLIDIFFRYGEEKFSKQIAKKIVEKRPINTTLELANVIKESVPLKYFLKSHPQRRIFQAIRIEVNNELIDILFKYGEEKYSKSIAKEIIKNRPINKTLELRDIIKKSVPVKYFSEHHPERKIFQAIRIEVNDELNVLEKVLPDAIDLLNVGGRISVITFHSLEDRIVKKTFKKYSETGLLQGDPNNPVKPLIKIINKKPILPSEEELLQNSRSRSAKLRIIERI